jgi:hypothetical protein
VRAVTIAVLVDVVLGDGLAPACPSLKLLVLDIDTGINDVDIDTVAATLDVLVLIECTKAESLGVTDTRKTLHSENNMRQRVRNLG